MGVFIFVGIVFALWKTLYLQPSGVQQMYFIFDKRQRISGYSATIFFKAQNDLVGRNRSLVGRRAIFTSEI